jgi:hypothetical protein
VQRPDSVPSGERCIGSLSVGAGLLGVRGDHRVEGRVDALDASEVSVHDLDGRTFSCSNPASEGRRSLRRQIVSNCGSVRWAVHSEAGVVGRRSVASLDEEDRGRDVRTPAELLRNPAVSAMRPNGVPVRAYDWHRLGGTPWYALN